jgi:hypothetical protein
MLIPLSLKSDYKFVDWWSDDSCMTKDWLWYAYSLAIKLSKFVYELYMQWMVNESELRVIHYTLGPLKPWDWWTSWLLKPVDVWQVLPSNRFQQIICLQFSYFLLLIFSVTIFFFFNFVFNIFGRGWGFHFFLVMRDLYATVLPCYFTCCWWVA